MAMHVIFPGPRTTVQDEGRFGYQNMGFPSSGFMDRDASHMANVLVGNDEWEALLEFCLIGPILSFDEPVNLAVCGGDFSLEVEGRVYSAYRAVHVPSRKRVRVLTGEVGVYGSLAISGGLAIPRVMGSKSTLLRCGIGGYQGRALMAGDVIPLWDPEIGREDVSWRAVKDSSLELLFASWRQEVKKIRVIPGPQEEMFTGRGIETFYGSRYQVTGQSDRMGYRLSGPLVEAKQGYDILSDGIAMGSIQISGNGEPIVMMADRQTTGGYAKIATVCCVDLSLFAKFRPGQEVEFVRTSVQEAQRLLRKQEDKWSILCSHLSLLDMKRRAEKKIRGINFTRDKVRKGNKEKGRSRYRRDWRKGERGRRKRWQR